MPSTSTRRQRLVRVASAALLLLLLGLGAVPDAQAPQQSPFFVVGRNVNTIGTGPGYNPLTGDFIGDPLYKQQNEVDCDVSPNDPRLILCAVNDYRGAELFGDSWMGVTFSDDAGLTWRSRLEPNFPRTNVLLGAADPVVNTVPGLGLVGYITISRSDDRGTLNLSRWLEHNKENGERYTYLDRVVIGSGTPGRFADKPSMTVVLNPAGGKISVDGRDVPNGTIHFGYAIFPGNDNNSSSEIYHLYSTDYGATWSGPKKLSASLGINQGIDLAASPDGNTVVAAWRRVWDTNEPDAIMFARSTDGGRTWSKAAVLSLGSFFDQDSADLQFRTKSMPSVVHDGTAFHAFWSARVVPQNNPVFARVLVSSSIDGSSWTTPAVVDGAATVGHQLMPAAAVAGGRVQVNWIDSRNNSDDVGPAHLSSFGPAIADFVYDDPDAEPPPPDTELTSGKFVYRQMVDVFAAQAASVVPTGTKKPPSVKLSFGSSQRVSQYRTGLVDADYSTTKVLAQLEFNFANARMFKTGAWPFHGDYHVVASQRYLPDPAKPAGGWIANTATSDSRAIFYSAFTDNRDVRGYVWAGPTGTPFTPAPGTMQGEPGTENPTPCTATFGQEEWAPGNSPRSRDQNVYAAATLPGLLVVSPSGSKPTGSLQRAYVVTVHNLTPDRRAYTLSIANQPPGSPGYASWERCTTLPDPPCAPRVSIVSDVEARSSISRTVYVASTEARPRILVNVVEINGLGQTGSVLLNADPAAPEIEEPDGGFPSILTQEIYQPDILARQISLYSTSLTNPEIVPIASAEYPRMQLPRMQLPRMQLSGVSYPRMQLPRMQLSDITYPRMQLPRMQLSSIENPRMQLSAVSGGDVTEVSWPVTTDGANTTTAMTAKVFVNGALPSGTVGQLLVTVPYPNGVANSCAAGDTGWLMDNQVVVNNVVTQENLAATEEPPDVVNPPSWQPSFWVKPGQIVWVTLRVWGVQDETIGRRAGLWIRSQPDTLAGNTMDEAQDGTIDVTAPVIDLGDWATGFSVEGDTAGGAVVNYTVTANDAVEGPVPVTCGPASGSLFPVGSTTVDCTATDSSGNHAGAGFNVTVTDTTDPTFSTGSTTPLATAEATSSAGALVSYSTPLATDIVDQSPTVSCSPATGTMFPLGTSDVDCTAADHSGNSASQTFHVTVVDTTAPLISGVPANIVTEATGPAGAVVIYTLPSATDLGVPVSITCAPAPGSTFPIGTTLVACTTADAGGNAASASFSITVRDTTAPSSITATVTPALLWPPNGGIVNVTVSGSAFDSASGVVRLEWAVVDEYKSYEPTGSITVAGNGPFSFQVPLLADRRGNDKNGRHYLIGITAVDAAGNRLLLANPLVVNVHDQSGM